MRSDAQRRRNALLQAAAECFNESGFGIALEDIAVRAGVGRGTLYRNFSDRMSLILAIFERELNRLDFTVHDGVPLGDTMAKLVLDGAPGTFLFARLSSEISLEGDELTAFEALGRRVEELMGPVAVAAQARGELRSDVGGRELALAVRMAGSVLNRRMTETTMTVAINEALRLLMEGLRPKRHL